MENINGFRKIGKYEISNACLQSYPCKHLINISYGEQKLMSGDEIYRLFNSEGLSDPHIDIYADFFIQNDTDKSMKRPNEGGELPT